LGRDSRSAFTFSMACLLPLWTLPSSQPIQ
jgi:hypothetical protein